MCIFGMKGVDSCAGFALSSGYLHSIDVFSYTFRDFLIVRDLNVASVASVGFFFLRAEALTK